jgi:hypothetical protein
MHSSNLQSTSPRDLTCTSNGRLISAVLSLYQWLADRSETIITPFFIIISDLYVYMNS